MSHKFQSIKKHITIEEARERGLIQIVKQLERDKKTRQSLGMRLLDDLIHNPTRNEVGRPKKIKSEES